MKDFEQGIAGLEGGDAIAMRYLSSSHAKDFSWLTVPRDPTRQDPPTLYLVNAGLSSMNAPLNVRVLDNVGLATPLASRQPRLDNARIGHDKQLDREWQVADSAALLDDLPPWVDEDRVLQARRALDAPALRELVATYRDPLDTRRFSPTSDGPLPRGGRCNCRPTRLITGE